MVRRCALLLCIVVVLSACQTVPPDEPEQVPPASAEALEPTEPETPEQAAEPETEPEQTEPEEEVVAGPIEVPEEVYNRAFEEVEAVINELNTIIQRGDFEAWREFLTQDYIEYHGDPEVLKQLSEQPVLAQNDIRLRSLRDYFQQVVRPSRARARLDSLVFYSDTLVEAVTVFRGESVILYLLRKTDEQWQIDTFEEPPSGTNS